jgi:preprotein translocase subunit SecB
MPSDQSKKHGMDEGTTSKDSTPFGVQPFPLPLFAVQLQNILPVEIVAKRFPEDMITTAIPSATQLNLPAVQLNVGEPTINTETQQAQVVMEIHVSSDEPPLFEISLKLVGLFTYASEYNLETVRQFLQFGSLSVILPSARELLLSLCTRLQIPMIILPLVQLAPPPPDTKAKDAPQ